MNAERERHEDPAICGKFPGHVQRIQALLRTSPAFRELWQDFETAVRVRDRLKSNPESAPELIVEYEAHVESLSEEITDYFQVGGATRPGEGERASEEREKVEEQNGRTE